MGAPTDTFVALYRGGFRTMSNKRLAGSSRRFRIADIQLPPTSNTPMLDDQGYEFDGVRRQNTEALDPLIHDQLGCYVYVYRTPAGRAFYVGKGGGGAGNSRVLDHFHEAEQLLRDRRVPTTSKLRAILEIWKSEQRVDWVIARHGLDDSTAMHVEAGLIDLVPLTPNGDLTNACRGLTRHGLLLSSEVAALGATPASPKAALGRVFVFQIHNALDQGAALYEAIRGNWRVKEANRQVEIPVLAVGVSNGICRVVCAVRKWTATVGGRYVFDGEVLPDHELLNKSFVDVMAPARGFLMFGGGYTIARFDGNGHFQCLRGNGDPDTWFACRPEL